MSTPKPEYTRIPGLIWLASAIAGGFGLGFIRNGLLVANDAAATIANVQSSEFLYRLAITGTLVSQMLMVFFVVELFRRFRLINLRLALALSISFVIAAAFAAFNTLNHFAALFILASAEIFKGFSPEQISSTAYALIRIANGPGQGVIELFWPTAYFTFGLLTMRSRVAPPVLGYLLMLMGCGFAVNLANKFLFPTFYPLQFTQFAMLCGGIGGLPNMLWWAIRGVPRSEAN